MLNENVVDNNNDRGMTVTFSGDNPNKKELKKAALKQLEYLLFNKTTFETSIKDELLESKEIMKKITTKPTKQSEYIGNLPFKN
jgi:hypothetical protein